MTNGNYAVFPAGDELPAADQARIGPDDYFSLYLESVCIARDETFWTKNVVALTVEVSIGGAQPVSLPIYSDRAVNTGGRLAINHGALMTYIPSKGNSIGIGASLIRFDNQDFIKNVLQALSLAQGSTALTTYAAAAVPYVTLAATVANQIYGAFGPKNGQTLIKTTRTALAPQGVVPNRTDLRDCYLLQYFGPDSMDDTSLHVHAGEVYWSNDTPLRSGPWFLFRIERFSNRPDAETRPWSTLFENNCLGEFDKLTPDVEKAKKAYEDALVLLENDTDFTAGDKRAIAKRWRDQLDAKTKGISNSWAAPALGFDLSQALVSSSTSNDLGVNDHRAMELLGFGR